MRPSLPKWICVCAGPGEVFGTQQHGMPHLKIAKFTDMETIQEVQQAIQSIKPALLSEIAKKIIIAKETRLIMEHE